MDVDTKIHVHQALINNISTYKIDLGFFVLNVLTVLLHLTVRLIEQNCCFQAYIGSHLPSLKKSDINFSIRCGSSMILAFCIL